MIKIIACLQKRLADFQPALREMHFASRSIVAGGTLQNLRRVRTRAPRY